METRQQKETRAPTLAEVEDARRTISGIAFRTPLVPLNTKSGDADIYLKLEILQPIGSFKIRGAANAMKHLSREQLLRGVVTASAGNMAQGLAWNARKLGVPCTVIVPETAAQTKLDAITRLGGRIIKTSYDKWWEAFETRTFPGVDATFVHAFEDTNMMAGNGTIGLEILEDLPDVDTIVIPWGGGGLACGTAAAVRSLKPKCKIFAAEVETAAPLATSWVAGTPQPVDYHPSFVDGIGVKVVFPQMLKLAKKLLDGSLVVSLEEVASAIRLLAERNRVIAEGAGACSVASAITGKAGTGKIVCVVSGGNIDTSKLCTILRGDNP